MRPARDIAIVVGGAADAVSGDARARPSWPDPSSALRALPAFRASAPGPTPPTRQRPPRLGGIRAITFRSPPAADRLGVREDLTFRLVGEGRAAGRAVGMGRHDLRISS